MKSSTINPYKAMNHQEFVVFIKTYIISLLGFLFGAISFVGFLDIISRIVSLAIAVMLAWYARRKYNQDHEIKKIEKAKLDREHENAMQQNYILLEKSKNIGKDESN